MPEITKNYSPLMSNLIKLIQKTGTSQVDIVCQSVNEYADILRILVAELDQKQFVISDKCEDPTDSKNYPHAITITVNNRKGQQTDKVTLGYPAIFKMAHAYEQKSKTSKAKVVVTYYQTDRLSKIKVKLLKLWLLLSNIFMTGISIGMILKAPVINNTNYWVAIVVSTILLLFCNDLYIKSSNQNNYDGLVPRRYQKPVWYWFAIYFLADLAVATILLIDFHCDFSTILSISTWVWSWLSWIIISFVFKHFGFKN